MSIVPILEEVIDGKRLSDERALELFNSHDIISIGQTANAIRFRKCPNPIVTYIIDRNINYTNICTSKCLFCAFYKPNGNADAYTLSFEEIDNKVDETKALGGVQILLQGGHHPDYDIQWYEKLVSGIKNRSEIHIHAFSPPEITHIAELSKISIPETIKRLRLAGLDSIPGGGAEILCDRTRDKISPGKCSANEWIEVMRQAHLQGIRTTATMMFGHIETTAERIESLRRLRDLQDETAGFTAFIPWSFQPHNTAMSNVTESGGFDYLKTLAISRLYLDNFDNLQASWVTQGPKVAQLALMFGANDMGSTMIEENVVSAAGVSFRLSEKDIFKLIESAGLAPKRRNMYYELIN
ncbi:MAG TPA: cyclic dehypoxanthinyl futalosine synthase [Nitrospinota bacterium]|nr:cyclic dehypoxanthinyl futalosine synthase [Nitrospinota bacterium]|tara:strand:+ start:19687 stop:20748 length:1062 start_codon:yes stop_codon:yes gene_type:complete